MNWSDYAVSHPEYDITIIKLIEERDHLRQLLSEAREALRCNAVNPKRRDIMEQSNLMLEKLNKALGE